MGSGSNNPFTIEINRVHLNDSNRIQKVEAALRGTDFKEFSSRYTLLFNIDRTKLQCTSKKQLFPHRDIFLLKPCVRNEPRRINA